MGHSRSDLASFQDGETRLVFARHRDGRPGLYLLEDGTAKARRAFAKEHLLCPVPDCLLPELTTVARTDGRDGFRHFAGGGGHEAESLFHLQGKARLAEWLRTRYPDSVVREEEASNTSRDRIADVMITAPNGKKVAFEIQYAALTPAVWAARHQSYVEQGIQDVWLFGHYGAQLRTNDSYNGDENVKLNPTHRALVEAGLPLLWFNPMLAEIATATEPETVPVGGQRLHVPASGRLGNLETMPLDDFRVATDGLWCDTTRKYARNAAEVARLREVAENALIEAERQRLEEFRLTQLQWEASPERTAILQQFGGSWPAFLNVPVEVRPTRIHQDWQARLFAMRESLANAGGNVEVADFAAAVPGMFPSEAAARTAVKLWFAALANHHYLRANSYPDGRGMRWSFVLTDPAEWARTQLRFAPQPKGPSADTASPTTTPAAPSAAEPAEYRAAPVRTSTCPVCRMPVHGTDMFCIPY